MVELRVCYKHASFHVFPEPWHPFKEMYSGPSRSFWELLQNADDCCYEETPGLKVIHALGEYLWLEYNEVGGLGGRSNACSVSHPKKSSAVSPAAIVPFV